MEDMVRDERAILITGATGFLGSHLTEKFVNEGLKVIILKRSFSNTWRINHLLDKVVCYDIDKVNLDKAFEENNIGTVIHTATKYGRANEKASEILESNLLFPLKLLETSTFFNADTFFNTDTILYEYLNSYALSKKQFVEWLKMFSDKIKIFNLKLEHIYGEKDDTSKFIPWVILQMLKKEEEIKLTKGEQKRDFIYVKDVIDAYYEIFFKADFFKKTFHEFNLGSGRSVTIKEMVNLVKGIVGNDQVYLNFGAIPYRKNEIMKSEANIEKLKNDIGWEPIISLEKGLKQTIEWYKRNGVRDEGIIQ